VVQEYLREGNQIANRQDAKGAKTNQIGFFGVLGGSLS
jgi:hypothetical protein